MGCKPELIGIAGVLLLALAPAAAAPRDPAQGWVDQARASYRVGDHFGALTTARQALARYPSSPLALELDAQLVRDAQGPVAALPLFERALERAPDNVELLGEYAATLADAGRHVDALSVARRMIALDPNNSRAFFLQALVAARAGDDQLARRLLWRTQAGDNPASAALLLDGAIELRSGSPAQAVDRFASLVRRQPDNVGAKLLLGRALLANGEANEVVARLGPLAARPDASRYLLALVGRAYEQMGARAVTARYLDRAARPLPTGVWPVPVAEEDALTAWRYAADPLRLDVAVPRLRGALAGGQAEEAKSLAAKLAARYPGSADVERLVGDTALLTGDPAAALMHYRHAGEVRTDAALVQAIVAAERALGHDDQARALLARRVALNPRERRSAMLLARLPVATPLLAAR